MLGGDPVKMALLASLFVAAFVLSGCADCKYPTSFWWDTRLVPDHPTDKVVSGTGMTDYTPTAVVAPEGEMH